MSPITNASVTLDAMSALMTRFAVGDGMWATAIPRLSFIRYSTPHQPMPAHYPPCFCLITQGSKSIAFGDDRLVYDAARFVVAAVDLPVTGVVLDATAEKPYLCVMLEIDMPELASLLLDAGTRRCGWAAWSVPRRRDAPVRRCRLEIDAAARRARGHSRARAVGRTRGALSLVAKQRWRTAAGSGGGKRAGAPDRAIDRVASFALRRATAPGAPGGGGAHEPVVIPRPFQTRHGDEPAAISEAVAAAGSPPPADDRRGRCRHRGAPRWVSKPQPV